MKDFIVSTITISDFEAKIARIIDEKLQSYFFANKVDRVQGKEDYATRKEVAEKLRISLPTLNTYTKDEILIGYRIGGRVLYKWSEVESVLSQISASKYKRNK